MLPRDPATAARRPVPAVRDRAARAPARRRSPARRFVRMLVVLVALLALAAVALIVADDQSGRPQLRQVVTEDARQAIEEVKQLIDENTR